MAPKQNAFGVKYDKKMINNYDLVILELMRLIRTRYENGNIRKNQ